MIEVLLLGLALVGAAVFARQSEVRARYRRTLERQIEDENEQIARTWRASRPREERLKITREIKPPGQMAPTVRIEKTYHRDL